VLFIPLLSLSTFGMVDSDANCNEEVNNRKIDVFTAIKQLGELRENGLITENEFKCKKEKLLEYI
jgi:hypothetical protein